MYTTLALTGPATFALKRSCSQRHGVSIRSAWRGKHAAPPEDCWGAWAYMERLEQHRLYPPLEAMVVVADAISTLWEADPQTPVRAALGDLDNLREAIDRLEAYQVFQPDHFDRGLINKRLRAWGQEEGDVRCR
jgi:hypothetical protein